jgi:hypothetical protein
MMAVDVAFTPAFTAGQPRLLYRGRFRGSINSNTPYDIGTDGRFLRVQQVQPDRAVTRIEVVLNWLASLR